MAHLSPGEAIEACETALRQLLDAVMSPLNGADWFEGQVTAEKLLQLEERRETERKKREARGVAATPDALTAYADLFTLRSVCEKNWQRVEPALGKKAETGTLLKRLDDLRNAIAHNRPLVPFEEDLVAGIAGEIRNRVTIFMSTKDPVGDIYPRIEFAQDSFGFSVDPIKATDVVGGSVRPDLTLHPGDIVTFTCRGTDPQGRPMRWQIDGSPPFAHRVVPVIAEGGETVQLKLQLVDSDVSETITVGIFMWAEGTPYHRSQHGDHRVFFYYRCRPPGVA
ncbi:hypothetical protein HZU40_24600 [Mycolicibacterium fluoranthenivorans]|uniref:Swt1-like HEPN domain-containing protein n=1 Tax=Mycolicibacterium fluoranthenivorans TaxID=258505 RepID=A0A7G8PAJ2_9MYCO|nr:hypothetical protein [Mycolicibacterium fluoranthenivorans]QNJ91358.1 hypothetical protein HZU40_24600 [Mycolicibacterium fluoranthenivorans]